MTGSQDATSHLLASCLCGCWLIVGGVRCWVAGLGHGDGRLDQLGSLKSLIKHLLSEEVPAEIFQPLQRTMTFIEG